MQTVFRLNTSELNADFIGVLHSLLKKEKEVEIIVQPITKKIITMEETIEAYKRKINKAIDNIENNQNVISFTGKEYKDLVMKLSKNETR